MKGYKTLVFAVLKIIFGALIAGGVMTPDQQDLILTNIDDIVGGGLAIIGVVDIILRKLTDSPMGKLLK